MKILSRIVLLAIVTTFGSVANAVVSFTGTYSSNLKQSDGTTNIPIGTRYIVVADTTNNGFGAATNNAVAAGTGFTVGGLFGGDEIIQSSTVGTAGRAATAVSNLGLDSSPYAGKKFALIWFETLTSADTTVSNGNKYGILAPSSWVLPTVAGNYGFTGAPTGTDFQQYGVAGFLPGGTVLTAGTVPEPSRVMLAAMGLGAFVLRRRRQA
jgi:hypothetical protein